MVPETLDGLTGEERHHIFRMLRLQVRFYPEGDLDLRGVLREAVCAPMDTRFQCHTAILPWPKHQSRQLASRKVSCI
jgi:hypothetical protein